MKRLLPYLSFLVLPFMLASENGVAEDQNKDRTGAPGSQNTCNNATCHTANAFETSSTIQVLDQNTQMPITSYSPGETYDVIFTVSAAGASTYGFQATVVKDSDASDAGSFENPGTGVQLEQVGTRHIIEHSQPFPAGVFTGEWVAPSEDVGSVTFYMSGCATNDSGTDSGDAFDGTTLAIDGPPVGISEAFADLNVQLTHGNLQIMGLNEGRYSIHDLSGRMVKSGLIMGSIDLNLSGTNYSALILTIVAQGETFTQKLAIL